MSITKHITQPTAWFTLEVTPQQFIRKMKLRGEIPLFYLPNENSQNNIKWLEERIVESVAKYNTRVIFIDHIHMIMSLARYQTNISLEIGDLVQRIKQLAIKYNLIVYLIAHCLDNKVSPTDEIRKEDIRDSGMIVRIADMVLGVWRINNDDDMTVNKRPKYLEEHDNKAKLRVLKNRRTGKLGAIALYHYEHTLTEHDPRYPYNEDGERVI
jgi:replicative DNA helicase